MTAQQDSAWGDELFHQNPLPMWVYARDTQAFLAVNDAAVQRYGYSQDEFLSMTVRDIRPPEDVPAFVEHSAHKPTGIHSAGIWRHKKKDGEIIHVEIITHELSFGGCEAQLVVAHEVTERVQAAENLRKHVAILEAVSFAAGQLLGTGNWESAVPAILERLGRATDVSRAYLFTADTILPDDVVFTQRHEWASAHARPELANPSMQQMSFRDNGFADWLPVFRAGLPVFGPIEAFSVQAQVFLRAQEIRSMVVVPIFVESAFWGFVGFDECRVVRVWTDAEIEALRTAAHVIGMGVQRSKLEKQFLQSQKMEVVGFLASGIAHDFNNALAVIFAGCDFLSMRFGATDQASIADVREIRQAAERGAALTRQLLSFSRAQRISPRDVDVNQTILELSRMIRRLLGEHIDVRLSLAPGAGVVHVDPIQLEQVLVNLAVNSRDAMPGGGRLTITTACTIDGDALCSPERTDGDVVIRVSDTGHGIPGELLERVCEPFFTTKPEGKGTGLGLAMAQRAVATAGGKLLIESTVDEGTTVTLRLPRCGHATSEAALGRSRADPGHRETVLVVEDDSALRKALVRMLSDGNYEPLEAANAEEALATIDALEGQVRVLVTDFLMPGMSGLELARRARSRVPGMKVLLCSGHADETVDLTAADSETLRLLRKPFGSDVLLEHVAALLAE